MGFQFLSSVKKRYSCHQSFKTPNPTNQADTCTKFGFDVADSRGAKIVDFVQERMQDLLHNSNKRL
jgi:hypothetical protein